MKPFLWFLLLSCRLLAQSAPPINRKALVGRHAIVNTRFDSLGALSVGNGAFAFTVDPTGLQTFPDVYRHGIPLGTQSEWGWHSVANPSAYMLSEVYKEFDQHGRQVPYTYAFSGNNRQAAVSNWFRENPHRLHLGMLGFDLRKADGSKAVVSDLSDIRQTLDLWTGEVRSHFRLENNPVDVITICHPTRDLVAVRVQSPLVASGRLTITLHFPYGSTDWEGIPDFGQPAKHTTRLLPKNRNLALLERRLDTTRYTATVGWSGTATLHEAGPHSFDLKPGGQGSTLEVTCQFTARPTTNLSPSFTDVQRLNQTHWQQFWQSGGAIDLSGSTDPRAAELERRIVLSQYLTKIQCAGSVPPQETGLTYNSWYGKPHLEMHWWHAAHFALWNRPKLLQNSLGWYQTISDKARVLARRQGFKGVRWPKMVDLSGNESPSTIGPFLIWQQPHFIYFAELCYRQQPTPATLRRYQNLLFATAEFMASYAWPDPKTGKYVLGKALIPAQERFKPETTLNPPFELAYWYWGLTVAQQWRERLGLSRNADWDNVLANLSPLPVRDGLYLAAESAPDSYTNPEFMTDHPAVLGAYGYLPKYTGLDVPTMDRTFEKIWTVWNWESTWGWDYPLVAMTATRLGKPDAAIEALLMPVTKNTFLPNGHNYQRDNLRLYLPGNGGLLTAVAMMCAGWDNDAGISSPGFPKNGKWSVRWENLAKMP